jgi:uncharacterized damage-inducible protein DinB
MFLETIRSLYDYNTWANQRILETAAQLTPKELIAKRGASYESVRDTLVHTMSAQWIWLARWKGGSPTAYLDPKQFPDLDSIRRRWDELERETRAFVDALTEGELDRVVSYQNTRGETYAYPLWQMMVHQVNHATQHRSEAAALLTEFGHSPGDLDYLVYIDVVQSK